MAARIVPPALTAIAGPPEVTTITFDREGMILEDLAPSMGRRSGG